LSNTRPANHHGTKLGVMVAPSTVWEILRAAGIDPAPWRHYYRAAKVLAAAGRSWLEQLVTRRVRPGQAEQGLQRAPDDIKVVMEFAQP
jgi:hypothetical protein